MGTLKQRKPISELVRSRPFVFYFYIDPIFLFLQHFLILQTTIDTIFGELETLAHAFFEPLLNQATHAQLSWLYAYTLLSNKLS